MTEVDRQRKQEGLIDSETTILSSHPSSQDKTTFPPLVQLNFLSCRAGSVMEDIIQYADQNAIHQRIIENQRSGQEATISLEGKKKLTAGTLFKAGKSILDHDVHDLVAKNREEKEKMEESVRKRKAEEWGKKRDAAAQIHLLQKLPTEWTVAQLKTMVAYKKNETDEKMPTKRAELYERYVLTCNRATPPGTPVASNEREDEEECDE